MNLQKKINLNEGKGIATKNPNLSVHLKINSGLLLMIYDLNGTSGGVIHLLEGEKKTVSRIRLLIDSIQSKKPSAKFVGKTSEPVAALVRKILSDNKVQLVAESVAQEGAVTIISQPAQGILRFKREAPIVENITKNKVKVMVVDDAPVIRKLLKQMLSTDSDLELIGEAGSAKEADELLKTLNPDVLTLDIHMPGEDGVSFLGRLLARKFIPAVMVTSVSMTESEKVFDALALGAIDYIKKPAMEEFEDMSIILCEKLKMAAKIKENKNKDSSSTVKKFEKKGSAKRTISPMTQYSRKLVAIGASTGGVQALTELLVRLPENIPPIVIVQHIPPIFSRAFSDRLDRVCSFRVKEAEDGDLILPNQVLIAPGGFHMQVISIKGKYAVRVFDSERVNRHKPAVDVLFDSVAQEIGSSALGILLTGMGSDGAEGLLKIKDRGALTIAQDEASSVVFGMPGSAIKIGAAQRVLPLSEMHNEIVKFGEFKKTG
jgi:two-component system chemotaxis response regulator CheB